MEKLMQAAVAQRRFIMLLLGSLSAIAVTLARVGITASFRFRWRADTRNRDSSCAWRARNDVRRMGLVRDAGRPVGIVIGVGGAFALTRLLASLFSR